MKSMNGLYLHACFQCQQCVEKALKGLIIKELGIDPPLKLPRKY